MGKSFKDIDSQAVGHGCLPPSANRFVPRERLQRQFTMTVHLCGLY